MTLSPTVATPRPTRDEEFFPILISTEVDSQRDDEEQINDNCNNIERVHLANITDARAKVGTILVERDRNQLHSLAKTFFALGHTPTLATFMRRIQGSHKRRLFRNLLKLLRLTV